MLTRRRSLENYIAPAAIDDARGIVVHFGPQDDVAALVARAGLKLDSGEWGRLSARTRRRLRGRAKLWLNRDAVECMTEARLAAHVPDGEVLSWFRAIATLLN